MAKSRREHLEQFIVYLHKTADKDLIDHLAPLLPMKRANAEMRRLMKAGFQRQSPQPITRDYRTEERNDSDALTFTPLPDEQPSNAKQKLKRFFG